MMSTEKRSKNPSKYSNSIIRSQTWSGSLPIVLSLAPTSLSSPTMPPPLHRMVSRMTYLHVALREDILHLYKYAPALTILKGIAGTSMASMGPISHDSAKGLTLQGESNISETNNYDENVDIPICWFEDEVTGIALRWHLFAGILYDLLKYRHQYHGDSRSKNGILNDLPCPLPWKIKIHFTSYPSHILSLEQFTASPNQPNNDNANLDFNIPKSIPILEIIKQTFSNSLKQSLFLQHGSSNVAKNMSKYSHIRLWDAIMMNRCEEFWEVSLDLMQSNIQKNSAGGNNNGDKKKLVHIPVRMFIDGKPHIQRPCKLETIQNDLLDRGNVDDKKNAHSDSNEDNSVCSYFTLGRLFSIWLPSYLSVNVIKNNDGTTLTEYKLNDTQCDIRWDIQGIKPPLSTPVADLWLSLCHPDQFLYVTVINLT